MDKSKVLVNIADHDKAEYSSNPIEAESIQAFKTKCLMKLLQASYQEHQRNQRIRSPPCGSCGNPICNCQPQKGRKLIRFGHLARHNTRRWTLPRETGEDLDGDHDGLCQLLHAGSDLFNTAQNRRRWRILVIAVSSPVFSTSPDDMHQR